MIEKLDWKKINDLLSAAKGRLVLVMPAVHPEWVETIKLNSNKVKVLICIDNSEEVLRNGYGSIKSIDELTEMGAIIKECDGLRVSFICSDSEAYCLFLESRILAGNPEGFNAIKLDSQTAEKIINKFFPIANEDDFIKEKEGIANPINANTLSEIRKAIEKNPPEEPDLRRKISTYTTLFQYAELHFEGANLSAKTVSIPAKALPFKDVELKNRMRAKISLFTEEFTKNLAELSDLKLEVEKVRKKYLVSCSVRKDKSILRKENKIAFQKEVDDLKKLIEKETKDILNKVQNAINRSEDSLKKEITDFLNINPPESVFGLDSENKKRKIETESNKILGQIKLPNASALISKIRLEETYFDLTWEDLKDEKLINWFLKRELITKSDQDKLASFNNVFEVKNHAKSDNLS